MCVFLAFENVASEASSQSPDRSVESYKRCLDVEIRARRRYGALTLTDIHAGCARCPKIGADSMVNVEVPRKRELTELYHQSHRSKATGCQAGFKG